MSYFKLIQGLKEVLEQDSRIKTITEGDIEDFNAYKYDLPAIAHIDVEDGNFEENLTVLDVSIDFVDYVNVEQNITNEKFKGNDNRQEVYNDMLNVSRRVFQKIRKFSFDDKIYVRDAAPIRKIYQFANDNRLVGWTVQFQAEVPDVIIDICETI
tara:strand:+ start:1188 stop:1652 length:465 start_codon:yes stop_codon:yes gene_type:complete